HLRQLRHGGDARVAGGGDQSFDGGVSGEGECERVLAPAAAEEKYAHERRSYRWTSGAPADRCRAGSGPTARSGYRECRLGQAQGAERAGREGWRRASAPVARPERGGRG